MGLGSCSYSIASSVREFWNGRLRHDGLWNGIRIPIYATVLGIYYLDCSYSNQHKPVQQKRQLRLADHTEEKIRFRRDKQETI